MMTEFDQKSNTDNQIQLTFGKLVFLGAMSMAISSFGPMVVFSAAPLAMAILAYGRGKGFLLGSMCLVLYFLLAYFNIVPLPFCMVFIISLINAFVISEVIFRKFNPVKSIIDVGLIYFAIIGILVFLYVMVSGPSVDVQINQSLIELYKKMEQENISLPKEIIEDMVRKIPSIVYISIFLQFVTSLVVVLRIPFLWRDIRDYPYALEDLIKFRLPDYFILPLIVVLIMALAGEYLFGSVGMIIGKNLIYCFGIFYLFQGFGVYLDFLRFVRFTGFFGRLVAIMTLLVAWNLLAIAGVFDVWIDFRKYFKEKKV